MLLFIFDGVKVVIFLLLTKRLRLKILFANFV
nr:MAG TPA: hypothetical protein [Caudoviricetes sp.]